jgi:hypothetical protein
LATGEVLKFYNDSAVGTNIKDMSSTLNQDFVTSSLATRFATHTGTVRLSTYAGGKPHHLFMKAQKLSHRVRYSGDTVIPTSGQIVMVVVADAGNVGSGTSTFNVPIPDANTGVRFNTRFEYFYLDE